MPRLSDQELEALLEAASKGPWEAVRNAVVIGTKSVLFDEEAGDADLALAAQAPALAGEVLDRREALAEAARLRERIEALKERLALRSITAHFLIKADDCDWQACEVEPCVSDRALLEVPDAE